MTMNIQPVNSSSGYSAERNSNGNSNASANQKEKVLENINTIQALQKAELKGTKVTPGDEQIVKNIERALKAIEGPNTTFEMSVHKETKAIVVKVLNKDTGELIREIPPEKTLDLVAKFMEINGILIDEKV